jgi:iron complex outermembrane receptor protein
VKIVGPALCLFCAAAAPFALHAEQASTPTLTDLSLEELANVEITSSSRRPEALSAAPTSLFVITGDDIRRSGVTSLPEALRLAPNLQVARQSNNEYAISARGFNSPSADKLLVLIDGRSVYSPLFSGVFWDVQNVPLADIERIEVISGPGGTVWGVNAVNGIINVITRSSAETHGGLVAGAAGPQEGVATLRWGGHVAGPGGVSGDWRAWARHTGLEHTETADGTRANDASHATQIGLRTDWQAERDRFTLSAGAYSGRSEQPAPGTVVLIGIPFVLGDVETSGANLDGAWTRTLEGGATLSTQAVFDVTSRQNPSQFADRQEIVDLQFNVASPAGRRHELVWGAELRHGADHATHGTPYFAFLPERLQQTWAAAFAQDSIGLGDGWRATAGLRVEHNDYTGEDWLPSLRLHWQPSTRALVWAAASRTVRAPSRLDRDSYVPAQPPFLLAGGPGFRSETANVFELGYRGQPLPTLSLSATIYHARYDHLHSQQLDPGGKFVTFANGLRGNTGGIEAWGTWTPTPWWRVHAGFNKLAMHLATRPESNDTTTAADSEGTNPSTWWLLRSSMDLPGRVQLDATLRHVSALAQPYVPAYDALDARLGWQPAPGWTLALIGRNLAGADHSEFGPPEARSVFARTWLLALEMRI